MNEEWRDVQGFEGQFQISDLGRVRSMPSLTRKTARIIQPHFTENGYLRINLRKGGKRRQLYIHRMVLLAFRGECPEGMEGCHDNGIKADCKLSNLRWDTRKNNEADKKIHGTDNEGFRNGQCKMTESVVLEIKSLIASGMKGKDIAAKFDIHPNLVSQIKNNRKWSHIV